MPIREPRKVAFIKANNQARKRQVRTGVIEYWPVEKDNAKNMVHFHLVFIRRSDGETQVYSGPSRGLEDNCPTAEQLDTSKDSNGNQDFYREIAHDDMRSVQWRRKLGWFLAHYCKLDQSLNYMLAAFPENYRLYEHIKVAGQKTEGEKKNHAGGGTDRQDAYLYGHPLGRKKRFRSPNDFYWHLHWLATASEDLDPDDCTCRTCCPEELKQSEPEEAFRQLHRDTKAKKKQKTIDLAAKAAAAAVKKGEEPPDFSPAARLALRGPSNEAKAARRSTLAAAVAHARSHVITPPKTVDQEMDSTYGVFMYRQGELVWFHRGVAWGLGVIISRFNNGATPHYKVQPLSWPGHSPTVADLADDHNLRPWLAWSVPPYTHAWLNTTTAVLNYATFDFAGLAQGRYGPGSIEVDASILAAKAIDATYTTFNQESRNEVEPGLVEVRWGGVYLGAEKIWVNDPVRVVDDNEGYPRVLVVRSIVERTTQSTFNTQSFMTGDVYKLALTSEHRQRSDEINLNREFPATPSRLTEDLRERNKVLIRENGEALYWKPEEADATFQLKDIKGRWYESTLLGPILLPQEEYEQSSRRKEYDDIVLKMNSRGDCNTADGQRLLPDVRTTTRVQAFGRAVPQTTSLVEDSRPPQNHAQPASALTGNVQPRAATTFTGNIQPQAGYPYAQHEVSSNSHAQAGVASALPHVAAGPINTQQHHAVPTNSGATFDEFMDIDFDPAAFLG